MLLVARQNINGIDTDEGLRALDGIMTFEMETDSEDELIDEFERQNPEFIKSRVAYNIYNYDKLQG